ncbi:hypothetical protein L2E82_32162 [Cichorium intybus]|uniref:Uncharacterized protein n=1 Tax=Cichorium intybus TaxID=13427 RepID=A0ACB9BFJ4_CICIN|nr:hypothetical protein L2E82_32162 [Cichorium intybus]
METESGTTLRSTETRETRRRIVLFPLPFQGHINPMLQLANILHTQGFEITIIHTDYNSPNHSNYPHFTFNSITDGFSEIEQQLPPPPTDPDAGYFLNYLNRSCVDPFTDCLAKLLAESNKGSIACLVTDAAFYFTQAVADTMKLPRMVLRTGSLSCTNAYNVLSIFSKKGCVNRTKEDLDSEATVPEYPLMKVKDVMKMAINPQSYGDFLANMLKQMKQDKTILSWLDTQAPKSVIYVSFGSAASITESEFQQVAYGLINIGVPFLWVVRPKVVRGSEWLESLPEKFLEDIGVMLDDGFEKVGIDMALRRVMIDKEGEEMRERACCLKEKVNLSLKEGGSSHQSLKSLVDYISSLNHL